VPGSDRLLVDTWFNRLNYLYSGLRRAL